MRRHITFLLLCALFIWGSQNALYSQSKEKPMLFWVQSERALPSKVFDYEDAQKNANEFIKKNLPTLQWYAYSSENDTYFYITPIESLSDLEKMEQTINEAIKKSGRDEMRKVNESFRDKVSSVETDIYVFDKDLSYVPKEPRVKSEVLEIIL